ncbi:glycoside hydrolase family 18 protein [Candidatus Daviesbacteria bacterium]|nr:glycoside hydrolase family 18 protein [Candidatus Daviesbacteria bacterium]
MDTVLPRLKNSFCGKFRTLYQRPRLVALFLSVPMFLSLFFQSGGAKKEPLISPMATTLKSNKEVFGFAPYWTLGKLDNVDFNTLTTLAYFGVSVEGNGDLNKYDPGYQAFQSREATNLFRKAHQHGTRVVLTLTQMNNMPILDLMDNPASQTNLISQAISEVQGRGIDGINVDFEYQGDPGQDYRDKFSEFVRQLTNQMHQANPNSKVTVSVYAASVKDPKIYDVGKLAKVSDGIFMMAYDFANAGADQAMPTDPLYGHKEGKYWYDISSAVEDFLAQMPANKLILGLPWYGYNYPVYSPEVLAPTWYGQSTAQTYKAAIDNISSDQPGLADYREGWDNLGQVGWKAYLPESTGVWRMIFLEDPKSLGLKYDFAMSKNLAGIGIWALGFDEGRGELWHVLRDKFGIKLADNSALVRTVLAKEEEY